ncbi:MAG: long-chain fatty acid--CoA ligase [Chloroflexi bacterium]|nr:long-chain fatty acid--CoA ligase [Chloroflexota bacterium]
MERGATGPRDDDEFDDLAYRLFVYQYVNNAAYRAWCDMRHGHPTSVHAWREIPSMPIAAFKQALLACETPSGAVEFNSSGTTNPEIKSRHVHPNLGLYDANAVHNFESHVIPDGARLPYLVLFPSRQELPHSSLAHWLTLMVERFGSQGSEWFVTADGGLNAEALANRLACGHEAVGILGASFGLVHFLEYCRDRDLRFQLPSGSRVMDTGGYKGRSREYPKAELYAMVDEFLGVPTDHIVNMYGLTEHGTQFLDVTLRLPGFSHKFVPPWARTLVVHPETLEELPPGEPGLLLHFDLINRNSVLAVLSEDIGLAVDGGFELLGRASGVEARGCSIAVDELIAMGTR